MAGRTRGDRDHGNHNRTTDDADSRATACGVLQEEEEADHEDLQDIQGYEDSTERLGVVQTTSLESVRLYMQKLLKSDPCKPSDPPHLVNDPDYVVFIRDIEPAE